MKVHEYKNTRTQCERGSVIALGLFDGVHRGHRELIRTARDEASRRGAALSVFTFRAEGAGMKSGPILYSTEEKLRILEELGVGEVIISDFSSIADMSAEDFIRITLAEDIGCSCAVAGFDFRFGRGAEGDAAMLENRLSSLGIDCITLEEQRHGGEKISTSRIKRLLGDGDTEEANKLLGSPYYVRSKVGSGLGLGRRLGIPTVNFETDEESLPLRRGVYRTAVVIDKRAYNAVTNIGTCPTFGERKMHAETNIIDFDGALYGEELKVYFLGYLREEKHFESEKELIMQINIDKNRAIKENGADKLWQEIGQS